MKLYAELKKLRAIPFAHSTLLSLLGGYKNPNEKIKNMAKSGELIRIKKELFVVGDMWREGDVCLELVANTIYGPSYVSLEWAMSYHGLIPERVYEISSICSKASKSYDTPLGRFTYTKAKKELFAIGITSQKAKDGTNFLIASKEKALCDKLIYTPNLSISSQKQMHEYLKDDLRIDISEFHGFDVGIVEECMGVEVKKQTLTHLHTYIKTAQGG